ncbi:hypothetical protein AAFF_G00065590 [Aldrovandia affinis]|uniref:Interleukin-12 beta central domain-containing protein n=1 Tax=Aldrovandia affinis TaxID=143900 RepID=A0AAD7T5K1_9TELE|nr:hypothetical protein AAFF_G00065590 [Aldrovandia affinis]
MSKTQKETYVAADCTLSQHTLYCLAIVEFAQKNSTDCAASGPKMYLSPWIALLLATCFPLACGLTSFPGKMQVKQMEDNVILTCVTDFQGQVTWKQKVSGHVTEVKASSFAIINGRSLHLKDLDRPNAGEYSCWGEGQERDHTYLLLEQQDGTEENDVLSCSAQAYSCSFICRWSVKGFTAARLSYHREGQDSSRTVHGKHSPSAEQGSFEFTVLHFYSPFAEEHTRIVVTVEAVSAEYYLKKTLRFYLRDIVQPDPPKSVMCEKEGKSLSVTVQPAPSWAQPLSYFPLVHQIEFIHRNNGKRELTDNGVITVKVSRLRARSRDPLVPSAWSKWSPWKNVTN